MILVARKHLDSGVISSPASTEVGSYWLSAVLSNSKTCPSSFNPKNPRTTLILFSVKVPVLSEQMAVALPIVSQLFKTRTKLPFCAILVVANANAKVTARGKPSGMATTTIVTAVITMSINFLPLSVGLKLWNEPPGAKSTPNLISKTINKTIAAKNPYFEIPSAKLSNLSCIGVVSGLCCKLAIVLPWIEFGPTAVTKASPNPAKTLAPEIK